MAKQTTVQITDDIDGSAKATEVAFSYNGMNYTIDLSSKNKAALEKLLKPYIEAGTQVVRKNARRSSGTTAGRRDLSAIRAWAASEGIDVSSRGRIAASVVEKYDAAH